MIDWLSAIDHQLFSTLNGWGAPFLDRLMIFMSGKYQWIPLYLVLVFLLVKKYGKQCWVPLCYVLIVFASNDQFTAGFMKPFFERLRPCHDDSLMDLYLVNGCGGKYGFASSHAANTMGLAISYYLLFGRRYWTLGLILWAILVGYSRIYLGVHFPGDVLVGLGIGILFPFLWRPIIHWLSIKLNLSSPFS